MTVYVFLENEVRPMVSWSTPYKELFPEGTYAIKPETIDPDMKWGMVKNEVWADIKLKDVPPELKLKALLLT